MCSQLCPLLPTLPCPAAAGHHRPNHPSSSTEPPTPKWLKQLHQYLTTLLPRSRHSLRYCCALGSWPAPAPHLALMETVEVREVKHSSRLGTEGWDRLFSLHPRALGAGPAAAECCPWLTGTLPQLGQREGGSAAPGWSPWPCCCPRPGCRAGTG